jgi:ribose 5-phosphate isomerase B
MKKVFIGTDHVGFELKAKLIPYLQELGYEVEDKGAFEYDAADDYPDFILPVAKAVAEKPDEYMGIVIGGSGQGEAIAANRIKGVRAALFYGPCLPKQAVDASGRESTDQYEMIRLTREHNNANVLSLGARFLTEEEAKMVVKLWLEAPFTGEERHSRRIKKIDELS